ncbi:MAG: HAD family hydrolase [Candidatus Woesearchaeota archaeon]
MTSLIFDLDNTLIDFMRFKRFSCEAAIDAMIDAGLSMGKKEALDKLYSLYHEEGLEDPLIFQKFLDEVGKMDYRMLAYGIVAYRRVRTAFLRPYPRVASTLRELQRRGYNLAILSDAPKLKAWIRLTNMGLDNFFDPVVAHEDTGVYKPGKEPFLLIKEKLPGECVMIGDNPERDLAGARACGMKACFARYGSDKDEAEADYVIDSIEELLDIF